MKQIFFTFIALSLITFAAASAAHATPLNRWKISCSVDPGAIQKKGRTWTFSTSANKCPGGIFNQRAEISTDKVSPNTKGTYVFTSTVAMTNGRNERFGLFQMHDGRHGCAPPLTVIVQSNNRLKLQADYKTGPGESCVRDVFRQQPTNVRFKRDGTPQKLQVVVQFLGNAHFNVQVVLDGKVAAQGSYAPPTGQGYHASESFYFKHGVYSQNMFPYTLVSQNMSVKRVRN